MSEKRAKRERKESAQITAAKKKDKRKTAFDAAVALIIVVVLGMGVWACRDKISLGSGAGTETAEQQQTEATVATVAQIAESEGISAEEFLAKCGMSDSGLTAESTQEEFYGKLTVANYASYVGKTTDELKAEYGIESVTDDALWQDAQMQTPMSKVAEGYDMTFEEFAEQNALPDTITADMTQGQALAIMQASQMTSEQE